MELHGHYFDLDDPQDRVLHAALTYVEPPVFPRVYRRPDGEREVAYDRNLAFIKIASECAG